MTAHPPPDPADGVLSASKALVGVAARSMGVLDDDLTLAQFRALLLVVEGRAATPGDLAGLLDVHPSNATRLVDRLVAKDLVDRAEVEGDRRGVALGPTPAGRAAVAAVHRARRRAIDQVLAALPADDAARIGRALAAFGEAAGEVGGEPADDAWRLGWVS